MRERDFVLDPKVVAYFPPATRSDKSHDKATTVALNNHFSKLVDMDHNTLLTNANTLTELFSRHIEETS